VAEAAEWAAIPRHPAWKDRDRRWRRRMVAGAWILVLLPLVDALNQKGLAADLPLPTILDFQSGSTLGDTQFWSGYWYRPILFCIGIVLLFSKERRPYPGRLQWTRRWGIICSYVVALLSAVQLLFVPALVLAGISALFMSMPLKYQPGVTSIFVKLSTTYLRYGPYPKIIALFALMAFLYITILLACAPLWDALCSGGSKVIAIILLAPAALFSLMNIMHAQWNIPGLHPPLIIDVAGSCDILAIAIWLSIAQVNARRRRRAISH
jgi:hypothetical protein